MGKRIAFVFLFLIVLALQISAAPIVNFRDFATAIQKGKTFVVLVDLSQCIGKPGMPTGYFIPKSMMVKPATETALESAVTSDLHFTDHWGKPTYEYIKYNFYADNTVSIEASVYDAQTFSLQGTPHKFECKIGQGIEILSND